MVSRRALLGLVAAIVPAAGAAKPPAHLVALGAAAMRCAPGLAHDRTELAGRGLLSLRAALRLIEGRSRAEFARGETVLVDGWVLSRTEAALCVQCYLRCRAA